MPDDPPSRPPAHGPSEPEPAGKALPPNPDPEVDRKRREIEREVYERRIAADKEAEDAQSQRGGPAPPPPLGRV